jgi:SAM-dependent methyltransferase
MSFDARARAVTGALQRFIVPNLRYAQIHFEEFVTARVSQAESWLDVGCGHQFLSAWRGTEEAALIGKVPLVVGVDYDFSSLVKHRSIHHLARADARQLPFPDATFDLVTANMVVEHLDDPVAQFAEISRVLRPGGRFLFHTPNVRSYFVMSVRLLPDSVKRFLARILEGRHESDVFPTRYLANHPADIAAVAGNSGLQVEALSLVSSSPIAGNVPPIAFFELLLLRQLERPSLAPFRSNILCSLRKTAGPEA